MNQYFTINFTERNPFLYIAIHNGIKYSTINKRAYIRLLRYLRDGVKWNDIRFQKFIARVGIGYTNAG